MKGSVWKKKSFHKDWHSLQIFLEITRQWVIQVHRKYFATFISWEYNFNWTTFHKKNEYKGNIMFIVSTLILYLLNAKCFIIIMYKLIYFIIIYKLRLITLKNIKMVNLNIDMLSYQRIMQEIYQRIVRGLKLNGETLVSNKVVVGSTMPIISLNHIFYYFVDHWER